MLFHKYIPPTPNVTPQELFPPVSLSNSFHSIIRYLRDDKNGIREFLVFTDGACSRNGGENPTGGCAFVFGPGVPSSRQHGYPDIESKAFPLRTIDSYGNDAKPTSSRAELMAVIGALEYRSWQLEGCERLVIATDSTYVVDGATLWSREWQANGWRKAVGHPVKNQDLWQDLLRKSAEWSDKGMKVVFWHIPRELNTDADRLAKGAVVHFNYLVVSAKSALGEHTATTVIVCAG